MGHSHGSMSVVLRFGAFGCSTTVDYGAESPSGKTDTVRTPLIRTRFGFERVLEGVIFRGIYPSHISEKI